MWVRLVAVLFVAACGPGPATGQSTGVIEGRVLDADSNAPLPRTHVFVVESMHGAVTDSSGRFRLEGVRPGPKRLYVSRVGHERRALALRPAPDRPVTVTVRLDAKVLNSPPVTVSAERDEEWYERLDRFRRLFIGRSDLAEDCTLVNPEVLRFDDKWWGRFEAWAEKPVIIENRALGYRLTYFLKEFEERDNILETGPDSTYLLTAHDRLEVVYQGMPERRAYLEWADLRRRTPRDHQTSQIELNERPLHIDPSGEIVEPYGATLYQYFAFTARMAKRLPREYEPPK